MKIAVCIKRVPDMETRFKIAANGTSVDETGLKYDMSDFDGYAVETALQLNEKQGPGELEQEGIAKGHGSSPSIAMGPE